MLRFVKKPGRLSAVYSILVFWRSARDRGRDKLVESIRRMNWFVCLGGIFASPFENYCINGSVYESDIPGRRGSTVFASWVILFELGNIVNSTVDDDPVQWSVQWN